MTWYVVASEADANPEDDVWTLSERPDQEGWITDFGCSGYGLPKSVAQHLADAANGVLPNPNPVLARYDDDTRVEFWAHSGGGHHLGAWGEVTLARILPDGSTEVLTYDLVRRNPGPLQQNPYD